MRSLAALSLTVALLAVLTTLAALQGPPLQAQSLTTLVSNTDLTSAGNSTVFNAQSFETGTNTDGYTVSEVDIFYLDTSSGRSTTVKIRENNADDEPGDLVDTLTNPDTLTANSLNTFTASAGTTLAASTTYWISVNEGIPAATDRSSLGLVNEDDETGETGWSIGDTRLWKLSEGVSWIISGNSLMIAIRGTVAAADPESPGAPLNLLATGASQTRINLSWNAPDDDGGASITGYRIEVSDDDESTWSDLVADTGSASRTYSHTTGLEPGDTRHYRVYASNSVGEGPESNVAMARTQTSTDLDPPDTMYIYFTESSSSLEESDEVTGSGNYIEGDCSGQKYFRGYWTEPNSPVADEWEVRVIPRDGASFSGIRVYYSNGNREHPEFTGRARFATGGDKHSYLIFEVRGRYGNDWSAWGPRSGLYCQHAEPGGL